MSEDTEKAVYMLVLGQIEDRDKMAAYQSALMASEIYQKNGGYYVAFGKPIDMFEGDWPSNQAAVIAKFPSLKAAQSFWNSDVYQNEIKPLREGAGTFTVAVFPET